MSNHDIAARAARLFTGSAPPLPKHVITHDMVANRLGALYPIPEGNPSPPFSWLPPGPGVPVAEHYIMPAPPPRSLRRLVEQNRHLFTRQGERFLDYLGSTPSIEEPPRHNGYLLIRGAPLKFKDESQEHSDKGKPWVVLSAHELAWAMVLRLSFGRAPTEAGKRLPLQCRTTTTLPGGATIKLGWQWVDHSLRIHAAPVTGVEKSNLTTVAAAVKFMWP